MMSARDDKVQGINVHVKNARTNISCAVSKAKDAMIEIQFLTFRNKEDVGSLKKSDFSSGRTTKAFTSPPPPPC